MKAEEAAVKLQNGRGYVVVGIVPGEPLVEIGSATQEFAGGPLVNHVLIAESPTDREDWDNQVRFLFNGTKYTARNPRPSKGQRFYRCRLEAVK